MTTVDLNSATGTDTSFGGFSAQHHDTLPECRYVQFRSPSNHGERSGHALRCIREALGLSARDFALFTNVSTRTVQRWETDDLIPGIAESALLKLVEITTLCEQELGEAQQVTIYRSGYREVDGFVLPESWWRALVGRALTTYALLPVEMK